MGEVLWWFVVLQKIIFVCGQTTSCIKTGEQELCSQVMDSTSTVFRLPHAASLKSLIDEFNKNNQGLLMEMVHHLQQFLRNVVSLCYESNYTWNEWKIEIKMDAWVSLIHLRVVCIEFWKIKVKSFFSSFSRWKLLCNVPSLKPYHFSYEKMKL